MVKVSINPAGNNELVVRAPFDDPPLIEHEYQIRLADRTQSVGNDEARTAAN